jgi:deoxyribonuclease (pyrimidine dimer)
MEDDVTRINVVPVDELTDNFLMAEYFELPRIFVLAKKHHDAGRVPADLDIPDTYRLGEGHMRFFYDKLRWLYQRHINLGIAGHGRELDLRVDPHTRIPNPLWFMGTIWYGNYQPTPEAIQLNWDRLQFRRRYDGGIYQGSR